MPQTTNKRTSALRIRNAGMCELVSEMEETVHVMERLTQSRMTAHSLMKESARGVRDRLENMADTTQGRRRTGFSRSQD